MAANPFASLISGLGIKLPGGQNMAASPSYAAPPKASAPKMSYVQSLSGGSSKVPLNYTPVPKPQPKPVSPFGIGGGGAQTQSAFQQATQKPNYTSVVTGKPAYGGAPTNSTPVRNYTPVPNMSMAPKATAPVTPKDQYIKSQTAPAAAPAPSYSFGADAGFGNPGATDPAPAAPAQTDSSSSNAGAGMGSNGGNAPVGAGTGDYRKQYTDLLASLYSKDSLSAATESLDELNKRMAKSKLFQRGEEERLRKNEAGALARGVEGQMRENDRTSAKELADLAIARAPYADMISNATAAYKDLYGTQQDGGFTLSEGQSRYELDPTTGQYRQVGSVAKSASAADTPTSIQEFQFAVQNGYTGSYAEFKNAGGAAAGGATKASAGQLESLAGFDSTVGAATEALNLLSGGVSTGPVAGQLLQLAKLTGTQNPQQLVLEQIIGKIKADFMKALSGAAVSDKEVVRLSKFLPDITDQESVIQSKLTTLINETNRAKANLQSTLGNSGGIGGASGGGSIWDF